MSNSKKSPKVVLVDYEEKMSLIKAAEFLETLAKKLREDGTFTLTHGGKSHEVTPAETVELEVTFEKKNNKHQLEVEIEWRDDGKDTKLTID